MRNLDILKQYVESYRKISGNGGAPVEGEVISRLITGVGNVGGLKADQLVSVLDVHINGDILFRKESYFKEDVNREDVEDKLSKQIIDSIIYAGINTLRQLSKELDQPGRPPEKNNDANFLKEPLSHANLTLLGYKKTHGFNTYRHEGGGAYQIEYDPDYKLNPYAAMSATVGGIGYIRSIENLEQLNYMHKAMTGKFLF